MPRSAIQPVGAEPESPRQAGTLSVLGIVQPFAAFLSVLSWAFVSSFLGFITGCNGRWSAVNGSTEFQPPR